MNNKISGIALCLLGFGAGLFAGKGQLQAQDAEKDTGNAVRPKIEGPSKEPQDDRPVHYHKARNGTLRSWNNGKNQSHAGGLAYYYISKDEYGHLSHLSLQLQACPTKGYETSETSKNPQPISSLNSKSAPLPGQEMQKQETQSQETRKAPPRFTDLLRQLPWTPPPLPPINGQLYIPGRSSIPPKSNVTLYEDLNGDSVLDTMIKMGPQIYSTYILHKNTWTEVNHSVSPWSIRAADGVYSYETKTRYVFKSGAWEVKEVTPEQ